MRVQGNRMDCIGRRSKPFLKPPCQHYSALKGTGMAFNKTVSIREHGYCENAGSSKAAACPVAALIIELLRRTDFPTKSRTQKTISFIYASWPPKQASIFYRTHRGRVFSG
jgi:hypothetical protein